MNFRKISLVLCGVLSFQLTACSFDKKSVRDEQDKSLNEEKTRRDEQARVISGTYEGLLTIEGKPYEILMTIGLATNGTGSSTSGSAVTARIKRSDAILPYDAILSGTYVPHGSLQLTNIKAVEKIYTYETSSIDARVEGDHLIGSLSQIGGTLGTFDVTRTSRALNLDSIDPCDSFYKTVRPKVEELTGTYEFTRRAVGWAPLTLDMNIQAFRNMSMTAVTHGLGLESMTLNAVYVAYLGKGLLYLNTVSNATSKEILAIELEKQDSQDLVLSGSYTSTTGRQGQAEIRKLSNANKFCP